MTATTLVTGAAGFAGCHLLRLLVAQRRDVVGWHRPGTPVPSIDKVRWRAVDVLDGDAVQRAVDLDRPIRVFHCAGAAHVGEAWDRITDTLAANVQGTHLLLEALRRSVPDARVLIPSSGLVYAPSSEALRETDPVRPNSPYGLSKLAQELIGIGVPQGPKVFVARPFNHFGPGQSSAFSTSAFARQIAEIEAGRREPHIKVGNLDARRDLTDVRDTVRAYDRILEAGVVERPYNVCSNRALPVKQFLDALLARATVAINIVTDPSRYRPNDTPVVLGDRERITSELGWEPTIPMETTLDDLLEHWRDATART